LLYFDHFVPAEPDSINVEGSDAVTFPCVRIEWTNGPDKNKGPCSVYPVQTRNMLIEDRKIRGAGVIPGRNHATPGTDLGRPKLRRTFRLRL